MWMKSRNANWEVEGQVHERIQSVMRESQQARLLKDAYSQNIGYEQSVKAISWTIHLSFLHRLFERIPELLVVQFTVRGMSTQ